MTIKIREKDGIAILDIGGNINIDASDLVESVGWVLNNKSTDILCNFEDVNLVDYVGISLIAVIYKNVLNHEGIIKFFNVPSHISKLFSIVGLNRVLECYASEEAAIEALKEDKKTSRTLNEHLRRRFKRIPFNTTIDYRQKFSADDNFYEGRVINLSAEGIFVTANQIFPTGDVLLVKINLFPKEEVLECDAKVVWIADEEIQPQDFPGMGLEFFNLSSEKQERIVQFVEKHLTHSAQDSS